MHDLNIPHKHFAALDGNVIVGYYIDILHDMSSLTLPYIEITEELWLALNEDSIRNEFINSSDIVYSKIYTIDDLSLFREVASVDVEVPLTPIELAIKDLQDGKADIEHKHTASEIGAYTKVEVDEKINIINASVESAKAYTDTKTSGLASTSSVDTKISTHNTSTSAHSDIRNLITGLTNRLNTLANSDDTTLDQMSEVVAYIKNNKTLIDGVTTSKVNVSDIINNLTTNVTNKPLSAAQGVTIKGLIDALQSELDSHSHDIADVTGLQSALDGKAASSHGTHVSYSSANPIMDGAASAGSASTVARSDHKHPTDTSRAAKTDLDSHTSNTTAHITSTERTNWNAAKTHADSAHAPSNAEKNQNAFSNIAVGSTTVSADTVTDTVTFVGSNVTITPDATNDKITFTVADGSTSAKGIVQLTNSTSSTSTTTAATPNSVKSAYDLANTAKTNAATAQTRADSAYALAESKVDSLSDLGITATATELNYVDGVTSNVQTQLDTLNNTVKTKANSSDLTSHTGNKSNPHGVTASQVGLGNVNNTSDANKPVSTAQATAIADAKKAGTDAQTNLDTHTANKSNPHGVTLSQLGVTATAAELNYVDGVTSNIQNQLDDKISKTSNTLLGDSVSTTWTKYGGRKVIVTGNDITFDLSSATGGWACNFASVKDPKNVSTTMLGVYGSDSGLTHVFMGGSYSDPAMKMTPVGQFTFKNRPNVGTTSVALTSDAAGTSLGMVKTGGDVTISNGVITVNDDSHNHTIANVDGLQSSLDTKASKSVATASANGLMSSTDKSKLDGIEAGAEVNVQPDWNAKEGEAGHIKNRTHWVEEGMVEILPETTIEIVDDMPTVIAPVGLEVGKTYSIVLNGTAYECVGVDGAVIDNPGVVLCGNLESIGWEDNGIPFILWNVPGEGSVLFWEYVEGSTIAIYEAGEVVHKIDPKFIDAEWIAKPEQVLTPVLPQATYTAWPFNNRNVIESWEGEPVGNEPINEMGEFIEGRTYVVTLEGTTYECVAIPVYSSYHEEYYFGIGNPHLDDGYSAIDDYEDNGLPFWATYIPFEDEPFGVICLRDITDEEIPVNVGISRVDEKVTTLDNKYLSCMTNEPIGTMIFSNKKWISSYPCTTLVTFNSGSNVIQAYKISDVPTRNFTNVTYSYLTATNAALTNMAIKKYYDDCVYFASGSGGGDPITGICFVYGTTARWYSHDREWSAEVPGQGIYFIVSKGLEYTIVDNLTLPEDVLKPVINQFHIPVMDSVIIRSITEGSTKKFRILVGDDGQLYTKEVT